MRSRAIVAGAVLGAAVVSGGGLVRSGLTGSYSASAGARATDRLVAFSLTALPSDYAQWAPRVLDSDDAAALTILRHAVQEVEATIAALQPPAAGVASSGTSTGIPVSSIKFNLPAPPPEVQRVLTGS